MTTLRRGVEVDEQRRKPAPLRLAVRVEEHLVYAQVLLQGSFAGMAIYQVARRRGGGGETGEG